jgi:hypothetical protein
LRLKFDTAVDFKNNAMGRVIGALNPNASTKELAFKTLQYMSAGKLYMVQHTLDYKNKTLTLELVPSKVTKQDTMEALMTISTMK